MHPAASARTSPSDLPNVQRTRAPGATRSICSRRKLTSAVASVGIVNLVLSSEGLTRKSVVSIASGVSRTFFHRKKALIWPAFLSVS